MSSVIKAFKRSLLVAMAALSALSLSAQEVVNLWDCEIPDSKPSKTYAEEIILKNDDPKQPRIRKVTAPTLTIFRPADGAPAKRTAIVICPGGAYVQLSINDEGIRVAEELASRGYVAVVLKYRLPSDEIMANRPYGPLSDAQRAIRWVRRNAENLDVDQSQVGIMGFSAGGHLAASASTLFDVATGTQEDKEVSARPDFTVLGYPVISMRPDLTHATSRARLIGGHPDEANLEAQFSASENVKETTPPAFIFHAADDKGVPCYASLDYAAALRRFGTPVDYHLFSRGGHGFGLGKSLRAGEWMQLLDTWISDVVLKK